MTTTDPHPAPRVPPGTVQDTGVVNGLIARVIGLATGGPAPHLFTTLGRHRRLFRPWLRFASRLMPGGALPGRDSELVILRVAHRAGSPYEAHHHEVLGAQAGLTPAEIAGALGRGEHDWSARQQVLLDAADQLVASHRVDDETWGRLEQHLDEVERIELPLLVGHYAMVAMTCNALQIEPDTPTDGPPRLVRAFLARRAS